MAQEAILRVSSILSDAGALCETVKNDYGEDIVAQTHINGKADNFSILIQVKSRELKSNKRESYSANIDIDHLIRWVSHHQPVLIAIYDRNSQATYCIFPRERYSLWELTTSDNNSVNVKFGPADLLNKEKAKEIIWNCRINYYSAHISWHDSSIIHTSKRQANNFINKVRLESNLIIFLFLTDMGIISENGISDKFLGYIRNCSGNFGDKNDSELKIDHVLMLCILGVADDIGARGVPINLLNHCTELLKKYFQDQHNFEYEEAQKRLSRQARANSTA